METTGIIGNIGYLLGFYWDIGKYTGNYYCFYADDIRPRSRGTTLVSRPTMPYCNQAAAKELTLRYHMMGM